MITVSGVRAGYGSLDILRGVDLHVEAQGITCIVGPNGAGKSTLLKAISGLITPSAGSIVVDGADITGASPDAILRRGIAQVPQRHGLFARLTVRQNVFMGAYVIRHKRKQLDVRYDELVQLFPLLGDRSHVQAGTLSGGQRRTVEFARAMMLQPKVVLLDEPTLGLDPRSLEVIRSSVTTMSQAGTTILMVEQNVRFGLALANKAVVMSAGAVALRGPAAEIVAHPDLMELFFGAATPINSIEHA